MVLCEVRRIQAGLLSIFALCAGMQVCAQGNPLTILTEEWPPYNYVENGDLKGFSVEIARSIMRELKIDNKIEVYPGIRATSMLNANRRVMFFTLLRTPERENKYKWIGPIGLDAIYFYKKKGNPLVVNTIEDVRKAKVVACRYAGLVYNTLKGLNFNNLDASTDNSVEIYTKLLNGRCELAVSDSPLGVRYWLKKMGYPEDSLVQTPVKVVESELYIACSLDIPQAEISLWQKALDKIKSTGEYDKLYRHYLR
jgi:polar amino acid transport system substrate-binding protein